MILSLKEQIRILTARTCALDVLPFDDAGALDNSDNLVELRIKWHLCQAAAAAVGEEIGRLQKRSDE